MTLVRKADSKIARPLKVLAPLIRAELAAADEAGIEHYRRAGEMLLEARPQFIYGSWGRWLRTNFRNAAGKPLSDDTARYYMRLAEQLRETPLAGHGRQVSTSVRSIIGRESNQVYAHKSWEGVHRAARALDAELFGQERQSQHDEMGLRRDLAAELVSLGYKALATRLHPDRGGTKDAFERLKVVRDELMAVAKTRRFI
jgi:hypothetical protein